ncbi:MAG: phosphopantetheine-binding protein [Methylococcaceae bacterium]
MSVQNEIIEIVKRVLHVSTNLDGDSVLIGAMPEFDSMSVVLILTALENQYGFVVDDDEITADIFETISTLTAFVEQKLVV